MIVLQINTNRSQSALDMAYKVGLRTNASLLLVSEPNKKAIKGRKDWIYDQEMDSAIKILDKNLVVTGQGHGHGFSYASVTGYTIYSCYCSPNRDIQELENTLQQIGDHISLDKQEALVAGDFNAKSPQWGMTYTDKRGEAVTEWIAEKDLVVANKGRTPTFQRLQCSSILDLTFVTEDIAQRICRWEVLEEESLSDHKYIMCEIRDKPQPPQRMVCPGWNLKKLNAEELEKTVEQIVENETTRTCNGFTTTLNNICEKTMPKKRARPGKPPVYWWNNEIAEIRKECNKRRRVYTRSGTRDSPEERQRRWDEYNKWRQRLKQSIKRSKRASWKAVCDAIDNDIWGNGYKIVMRSMTGFPPRSRLSEEFTKKIADHLFPVHEPVTFQCDSEAKLTPFTEQELTQASNKLKSGKAPGPGKIPAEILKKVVSKRQKYVLRVYNSLAENGIFPKVWKRAELVLLRKGDKSTDMPSSYRPISLLDVEGKLYEQLVAARLRQELKKSGDLSDRQYGFREGRQTVDAIKRVLKVAGEARDYASRNRRYCAMITLDVRNAFNNASWQKILEELRRRNVDEGVIRIIASYLSERETGGRSINSGVPQGSVLGPLLWNILYDGLLEIPLPVGAQLIGFADDIALVVVARTEELLMSIANTALLLIARWLDGAKLQLAPEKTEAVILTTRTKVAPICFEVEGIQVKPSPAIKYLGVWIDSKLNFKAHFDKVSQKAEKTLTALSGILPNIGGARASKRRMLASVVHSQILYAAPIWSHRTEKKSVIKSLKRVQRGTSIRIASAYRTISAEAVGVIAGVPPIDLMAQERNARYNGEDGSNAREDLLSRWQERWDKGQHGRWTHSLIPNIRKWLERPYGEVDYFLTQALSGHGCFRKFLFGKKRADSDECPYCEMPDDAEHTLFVCEKWSATRDAYRRDTGISFEKGTIGARLYADRESWIATYGVIKNIIEKKEVDVRQMQ